MTAIDLRFFPLASLLFCGAIFGFFHAWVRATLRGMEQADPRRSIPAIQAMNASVRTAVFAPAVFGTPIVLAITAIVLSRYRQRGAAVCFGAAAPVYPAGGPVLTMGVRVPLNRAPAAARVPATPEEVRLLRQACSAAWRYGNAIRMTVTGAALLVAGYAIPRCRTAAGRRNVPA